MLRASSTLRAAPAARVLRASAARRGMVATPMDDREKAFESAWAREEQRKALDALKKTMAVKRTPINEDFEVERLTKILDKAGVAKGAERDALKVRLLLWKHDEVHPRQPTRACFASARAQSACWPRLSRLCAWLTNGFSASVAPAGSRPGVQVGGARESRVVAQTCVVPVRTTRLGGCGGGGECGGKRGGGAGGGAVGWHAVRRRAPVSQARWSLVGRLLRKQSLPLAALSPTPH